MDNLQNERKEDLLNFHLPRWNELPDMELYMDQVVSQLDKYLSVLNYTGDEHFVTASMINNYVKQQLLPPPVKKKYSRTHMAHLILICIFKQVLTIPQVKLLISTKLAQVPQQEIEIVFDFYCELQEEAFKKIIRTTDKTLLDNKNAHAAVEAVTLACAGKALAESLLN